MYVSQGNSSRARGVSRGDLQTVLTPEVSEAESRKDLIQSSRCGSSRRCEGRGDTGPGGAAPRVVLRVGVRTTMQLPGGPTHRGSGDHVLHSPHVKRQRGSLPVTAPVKLQLGARVSCPWPCRTRWPLANPGAALRLAASCPPACTRDPGPRAADSSAFLVWHRAALLSEHPACIPSRICRPAEGGCWALCPRH